MSQSRLFISTPLVSGSRLTLDREQAHYLGRVLRKRAGDDLLLFDDSGREFAAVVNAIRKDQAELDVGEGAVVDLESPLAVRLLQSVCKGERMDFVIQKATELGVVEFLPVISERTIVRLGGDRAERRTEHWQRIAASACEQSGRTRVPRVHQPRALVEVMNDPSEAALRCVLAPGASTSLRDLASPGNGKIDLLIGPEGGLGDAEVDAALRAGFTGCSLGPRILRTETAGVAAIAALQSRWGDL